MAKESHPKLVKEKVVAIATGYYKGRIIPEGEKFLYEGPLNRGKLPLWVKTLEGKKAKEVEVEASDDLV